MGDTSKPDFSAGRPAHGQWPGWMTSDWAEFPSAGDKALEVWGYVDRLSYAPGDSVRLHVSTPVDTFEIEIFRDGALWESMYRATELPGRLSPTPRNASTVGCGWPVLHEFVIPDNWRSGAYVIVFRARRGNEVVEHEGFFALRALNPGSQGKIALVLATSTWIAYNNWAGGSSYTNPDLTDFTDLDRARKEGFVTKLSTERPWARGLIRLPSGAPRVPLKTPPPQNWAVHYPAQDWSMANGYAVTSTAAGWAAYDALLARWLERQGYEVEYLTQHDLHFNADALAAYRCVLTCGHDEYWSHSARTTLDSFIEAGGRLARFGGNIFWQIRYEDEGTSQVCYKYIADELDPLKDDPTLFTAAFEARSLNQPPVTTWGANGAQGVYSRLGGSMPRSCGGFTVYRNKHWAFADTDLYYGDVLGADLPLVGYESDGIEYTFRHGLPYPTGEDGTPDELEILALSPASIEEEDHGHPGQVLQHGDGDLMILCQAIHGDTSEENLARMRYGSAVITHMPKGKGEVFCAATTEWPYALDQRDPFCEQITRNVLDRYSAD